MYPALFSFLLSVQALITGKICALFLFPMIVGCVWAQSEKRHHCYHCHTKQRERQNITNGNSSTSGSGNNNSNIHALLLATQQKTRRYCTMNRSFLKIGMLVMGLSLVRLLVRLHRPLIRALCCTHPFACSPTHSLRSS